MAQVHATGACAQPVRLSGRVRQSDPDSGEVTVVYSSAGEPDRVLLKACGTRRATRCPACAALYRGDAKALLRAGLTPAPHDGTAPKDGDGADITLPPPVVKLPAAAGSVGFPDAFYPTSNAAPASQGAM